jgi:uncharacterized protein YkwD
MRGCLCGLLLAALIASGCAGRLDGANVELDGSRDAENASDGATSVDAGAERDAMLPADASATLDAISTIEAGSSEDASAAPRDASEPDDAPIDAAPAADAASTTCGVSIEREELMLTNAARAANGLVALTCDPTLTSVARAHGEDMCNRRYFDHVNPEGMNWDARARAAGWRGSTSGENIAAGYATATEVHDGWMTSPPHRANILFAPFRRVGIGYVSCDDGEWPTYWTQVFSD